jgi:SOS-response transcriptional repressor LexA
MVTGVAERITEVFLVRSGELVQQARKRKGYTQRELAEAIGKTHPTISGWEQGRSEPSDTVAVAVIQELGMSTDALMGKLRSERLERKKDRLRAEFKGIYPGGGLDNDDILNRTVTIVQEDPDTIKIPIIATVPAGEPIEFPPASEADAEDYVTGNGRDYQQPEHVYALRVVGTSMINFGIMDGDIIIVDSSVRPENGDIVVACIGRETTVKQFRNGSDVVVLEAGNPDVASKILRGKEIADLKIQGVVTESRKKHR